MEFQNKITRSLDDYIIFDYYCNKTYILYPEQLKDENNKLIDEWGSCIRVPGATRGCIVLTKDFIIKDIILYEDQCFRKIGCYKRQLKKDFGEIKKRYIGSQLVFKI
jgi:hypothetical protein